MNDVKVNDRVIVKAVLYPTDFGFAIGQEGKVEDAGGQGMYSVRVGDRRVIATEVEAPVEQAEPKAVQEKKPAKKAAAKTKSR